MMESCARVIGMFPEYAEGELSPPESGRVSSHLEKCGACALRVKRHKDIVEALDRLPQVVPPDCFRTSVMSRVIAAPLRRPARRPCHLRLVKALFWLTLAGAGGSAAGAGACLWGRDFAGRTHLLDPSFYADWAGSLGRFAFSLLLDIATRAGAPGVFSAPHNPFAWGGLLSALLLSGLVAGAVGLGVLATARVLLGSRVR
jgi:anti-sigma factor RsiW